MRVAEIIASSVIRFENAMIQSLADLHGSLTEKCACDPVCAVQDYINIELDNHRNQLIRV